jgi:hypothetical protein
MKSVPVRNPHPTRLFGFCLVCLLGLPPFAQSSFPRPDSRLLDETDPDFPVQGEYSGKARDRSGAEMDFGAQMVALGDGAFRAVFFPGGLPGDGWTGMERFESEGLAGAGGAVINGGRYNGSINGDSLIGGDTTRGTFVLIKRNRVSPTMGLAPPAQAAILFDGGSVAEWSNAKRNDLGYFEPLNREAVTRKKFSDFSLHMEFRLPFKPFYVGQVRANSGVRFMDETYLFTEIQILDSFGGDTGSNESGGLEGLYPGLVTANFPPMAWQTFDIHVNTPSLVDSAGLGEAVISVWQNGILIHPARIIPHMAPSVAFALQSLDSAGGFRNIWLLEGNDHYPFFPGAAVRALVKSRSGGRGSDAGIGPVRDARSGISIRVKRGEEWFRPNGARVPFPITP